MARLMRKGVNYQENFTLREYGSWKKAEAAAKKWVAKMKEQLPAPETSRDKVSKRNQSGVVGVWPSYNYNVRNGKAYHYSRWYARWPGCPIKSGIGFSVNRFGDDDAFALAVLARTHETVDREWLEKKLKSFKKTKKYQATLEKKQLEFV